MPRLLEIINFDLTSMLASNENIQETNILGGETGGQVFWGCSLRFGAGSVPGRGGDGHHHVPVPGDGPEAGRACGSLLNQAALPEVPCEAPPLQPDHAPMFHGGGASVGPQAGGDQECWLCRRLGNFLALMELERG